MTAPTQNPAELYEQFYGPAIFQPLAEMLVEVAAPRPGERVLDLACGTGLVARRIAPTVGPQGRVVGLDINPAMLAVAREQAVAGGPEIEWRQADAVEVDLPGEEFDLVLCQQGLQFFSNQAAALRRVRDLLVPGGRVALAVWQGIERQSLFAEFVEVEARHLAPLGVTHEDLVAPFSLGEDGKLRALLEGGGFSRIEIVPRSLQARFPSPESFARRMETAYGAVVPAFVQDPAAFETFLDSVERDTRDLVRRYSDGDTVSYSMHTNLALAYVD
jgi:SAM-dependent methyltransferase